MRISTFFYTSVLSWFSIVCPSEPQHEESALIFVQISDTHFSYSDDLARSVDLENLLTSKIAPFVKPRIVIISGDITNAVLLNNRGEQVPKEWKMYSDTLNRTGSALKDVLWWDVRGNHDVFRVHDWSSGSNLFRLHSVSGTTSEHSRVSLRIVDTGTRKYPFIILDTSIEPGIGRLFNFYGYMNDVDYSKLKNSIAQAKRSVAGSPIIIIAHHPVKYVLTSDHKKLGPLISENVYYISGHLHTSAGWAPEMYYKHNNKLVELELGDWKDNRKYRIGVLDRGVFRFKDAGLKDDVVVVMMNPAPAGLVVEEEAHEFDIKLVRMMVFSFVEDIKAVTVSVGKNLSAEARKNENSTYWVAAWNPEKFSTGFHEMCVQVQLVNGDKYTTIHHFSMDDTEREISRVIKFLMENRIHLVARLLMVSQLLSYICLLIFFRKYNPVITRSHNIIKRCWYWLVIRMNRLCGLTPVFCTLLFSAVYCFAGPWVIGQITDASFGAIFVWGTWSKGSLLPNAAPLMLENSYFALVQYPATFGLAIAVNRKLNGSSDAAGSTSDSANRSTNRTDAGLLRILIRAAWHFVSDNVLFAASLLIALFMLHMVNVVFPYAALFSPLTACNPSLWLVMRLAVLCTPALRLRQWMKSHSMIKIG